MFNVTVLRGKDIIKYFIGVLIFIVIIILISINLKKEKNNYNFITDIKNKISSTLDNNRMFCLKEIIPNIDDTENIKVDKTEKENIYEKILKEQISSIVEVEKEDNINDTEEKSKSSEEIIDDEKEDKNIEKASTNLDTRVITKNPISENVNRQYGDVKIKNQTSYELTDDVLNPNITIENKKIILFHTHSCESYMPTEKNDYEETGTFRTTDLNYSVVRVGTELENQLKEYNYNVIHNTSYHDYPSYNGSYSRSLATVEDILKENPSDIIIDIHRDAIGSRSDYAPTVKIGDDEAAQIMFVIGTNEGGLWHPNWNQNLKFAVKIQQKAEEIYPGLFKPIMLTKSRYNQHTGKYASIIEVGATGNTLGQCLNSMKYLAKVIDEVLK